jgi:xanthine dehydrogenase accessory factor
MVNIYAEIDRMLGGGKTLVLARIIRQTGSAPRTVGTKMIFSEDGTTVGTIGGGALEFETAGNAREVFAARESRTLEFRLTGREVAASEMLCGGAVDVHLAWISPADRAACSVYRRIHELVSQGRRATLITVVSGGAAAGGSILIADDHSVAGAFGGGAEVAAVDLERFAGARRPVLAPLDERRGEPLVFVEPVEAEPVLYLFGAGHIATFLAPLAKMVGFRVCVIDDRGEFANAERFPAADEILACPFGEAFQRIAITPSSFIAIITRGHSHDHDVLRAALGTHPAYIGMIGSRRKRDLIFRSLSEQGVPAAKLAEVHSPIGLPIGAETPEEIAVSIVAELIRVWAEAGAATGRPAAVPADPGSRQGAS